MRIVPILVGIIPTQWEMSYFVPCVGIFLAKFHRVGMFPTKFSIYTRSLTHVGIMIPTQR